MWEKWLRKILNRRQGNRRIPLQVPVFTTDPDGKEHEVVSEDVSDSGVRLRFQKIGLTNVLGHREEVPLKIRLSQNEDPVITHAQLVWAYNTVQGGSVSGWRFVTFDGNSEQRLGDFLSQYEGLQTA